MKTSKGTCRFPLPGNNAKQPPMKDDDLVQKANQIAAFFAPYPEDEAVKGVANHLAMFWDPRMRKQLLAIAAKAKGLDPLVRRALDDPAVAVR